MKVTQFFLFFGPRLWSFRRGETEYGVRALPLGAFVRIIGMNRMDEVEPGDEARSYRQQSFPKRLLVISAGSIMHILIAIVLLFGVYSTQGEITAQDEPRVIVGAAAQELPAWGAGIRDDDEIVSVDGIAVTSSIELGETVRSLRAGRCGRPRGDPRRRHAHDPGRPRGEHVGSARTIRCSVQRCSACVRSARRSTSSTASPAPPSTRSPTSSR